MPPTLTKETHFMKIVVLMVALVMTLVLTPAHAAQIDVWYGQLLVTVPPTGQYVRFVGTIDTEHHPDGTRIVGWRLWVNQAPGTACYMHLRDRFQRSWDAGRGAPGDAVMLSSVDWAPLYGPLSIEVFCQNTSGVAQSTNASVWVWYRD